MNSLLVFQKNEIEGEKALNRSLKCYPSLSPTPSRGRSPFRGGTKKRMTFQTSRSRLENLRNFRVFKEKFFAVLATSSRFCISEQRLGKIQAYGTFQARKSEQFDRGCPPSSPGRFSLALEVGRSTSKDRENVKYVKDVLQELSSVETKDRP